MHAARLAVDIGGTFTDLALEHAATPLHHQGPDHPGGPRARRAGRASARLADAGIAPADIGIVIHGTTLATNALIERKGARTALITTRGFSRRDRDGQREPLRPIRPVYRLPPPLVPRHLRLAVPERLDSDGNVLLPLDEAAVRALAAGRCAMPRASKPSRSASCTPSQSAARATRRATIVRDGLPEMPVSLSSDVSPEMREYERFSTTCANAYVQPLMARYLRELGRGLRARGVRGAGCS